MRRWPAACGLAAGVVLPVGVYWAGGRGWALALWAGAAVGVGHLLWVRRDVARAFAAGAKRSIRSALLASGALRTVAVAVGLVALCKVPGLPLWAVLLGFILAQSGAAVWMRRRSPAGDGGAR